MSGWLGQFRPRRRSFGAERRIEPRLLQGSYELSLLADAARRLATFGGRDICEAVAIAVGLPFLRDIAVVCIETAETRRMKSTDSADDHTCNDQHGGD